MDKFQKMIELQKSFRIVLGNGQDRFETMTEQEKGERLYHTLFLMIEEIMEVVSTLNHKEHCKEAKEGRRFTFKNKAQTYEELLGDVTAYFLDAIALTDASSDDVLSCYSAKVEINKQRQLRNYSQSEKIGNEAGLDSRKMWEKIQSGDIKTNWFKKVMPSEFTDEEVAELKKNDEDLTKKSIKVLVRSIPVFQGMGFLATIENTNEAKEIHITEEEYIIGGNIQHVLCEKICREFNLTETFEIVEV